jgi:hypothetical protein
MVAGMEAHSRLQWQYRTIEFVKQVAIIVVIGCGILLAVALGAVFLVNR